MDIFLKKLSFALFVILLSAAPTMAESIKWSPEDGVAVRKGWYIEWFCSGASRTEGELAGEVACVWSDCRNDDCGVFLQVIDTDGELKFDAKGIQVADVDNRQKDPVVCPSLDGGWFVAWEDFSIDSLGDIYCTKIDAEGNRVWAEDNERGVPVCVFDGIQEDARIVYDRQGGCIIAWRDMRGGDTGDIYAMHILAEGRSDPDWLENGLSVVSEPGPQIDMTICVDEEGGMIIGWQDHRLGGNPDIWAQRITPEGDLLWGDGDGIPICNHRSNQESPKLCPDGDGGAFFTWLDDRNMRDTDRDIYAQRVDSNGNLLWSEVDEGVPLCTEVEEQTDNQIVMSEPGNAIVFWADRRVNGEELDIYTMRISGDEEMIREWQPEQGVPLLVAEHNQEQPDICADGEGGVYFAWQDERYGGFPEVDIWAQRLNSDGNRMWGDEGIVVCGAEDEGGEGLGHQSAPLVHRTADGGCSIMWGDGRTGSAHIYAQLLSPNGEEIWEDNGIPLVEGLGGNAIRLKVLSRGNGEFIILWLDGRFGTLGAYPFIQYCRDGGDHLEFLLEPDGIPVITGALGSCISPDVVIAEDGETIVVWEDHRRNQRYSIYTQKVSEDGDLMWGETGVRCSDFEFDQNSPKICNDGEGGAIVAWKGLTNDWSFDIYMQRLDEDGNRLWGDEGIRVTGTEIDELVEAIISDGEGGAVILWLAQNSRRETDDDLWIERFDPNGESMWGDSGVVVCQERNKQRYANLKRHQNGFVVVWVDGRDDDDGQPQNDIYGQFIESDGAFRWMENGYPICSVETHQENPVVTIDNEGYIWVVWEDYRFTGTPRMRDIYMQKLHFIPDDRGRPREVFNRDGIPLCMAERDQIEPDIVHDGQNGVWIVWEDYRLSGVWSDIYSTHLRADGEPYDPWDESGDLICGAFHKQDFPQVSLLKASGETGVVVAWEDKRCSGMEELSGIYVQRVDDDLLSVRQDKHDLPLSCCMLEDPYPNPFNSNTMINFQLPGIVHTTITVYDLNGREVEKLIDQYIQAGNHRVTWNSSGKPAGIYYCRMTAGNYSHTVKLTLVW